MNWHQAVDIYCERTDPSFWSEPVNFLTNLSFLLAAAWCHVQIRKHPALQRPSLLALVFLAYSIGIGSALFHSVATNWAQAADVIPIGIFLFAYIGFYGRVLAQFSVGKQIALFALFAGLTIVLAASVSTETANGSNMYFGSWAMLCWFAWHCRVRGQEHWRLYFWASAAFLAALIFRTVDMRVCEAFPLGTHFLWHTLNGVVIFLVLLAAMRWLQSGQPSRS